MQGGGFLRSDFQSLIFKPKGIIAGYYFLSIAFGKKNKKN